MEERFHSAATPPGIAVHVFVRPGESAAKCTIRPLRGTPGIAFHRWPPAPRVNLGELLPPDALLLAPDAPPLTPADAARPLVLLDASWRHAARMLRGLQGLLPAPLETRSIPSGWQTAYPRHSKTGDDPPAGLATVEALYAALATLHSPLATPALLSRYPFADAFLELNAGLLGAARHARPLEL